MCGRYAITLPPEAYRQLLEFEELPNFPPRYNVAPTQAVPVVRQEEGRRRFRLMRWGFLPGWVKDPGEFPLVINARGETLLDKPTFRNAVRRRRCVFLADGFYEWRREGREKAPFLIRPVDRGPLLMAGLWETYHGTDGAEIDTAAIVTTSANGAVAAVHDRMPVILGPEGIESWLAGEAVPVQEAMRLVRPCPEEWLDLVPISSRVNKVANDDASVQQPLAAPDGKPVPEPKRQDPKAPRNADEDAQGALF